MVQLVESDCKTDHVAVVQQIGKYQNHSSSSRQNRSFIGCNQSKCNDQEPILPYGSGSQHVDDTYIPHQTSGPNIPNVAPPRYRPQMFFCEICEVKTTSYTNMKQHNNGKRHQSMLEQHKESQRQKTLNRQESGQMPNSLMNLVVKPKAVQRSKKNRCLVENVGSVATINKHKGYLQKNRGKTSEVLVEETVENTRDNFAVQGHGFKRKISGASGGKFMTANKGIKRYMESSKHDINARSNYVESQVHVPAAAPPPGPVASHIMAPTPVMESSSEVQFQHVSASQMQVSECKSHHEIQYPSLQRNDQSQSTSLELHAPPVFNINIQTEDENSDSEFKAIAAPQGLVASQVFAPPPTVEPNSEPQIQNVLHTETEPQVSEAMAVAHNDSQNPTDETNIQLPSSVFVEYDAPASFSTNTQTADGSSKAEEKMDGLTTELGITQLPKVTFCLKGGDAGFPETLVFCNNCQVHELHRCCLDGPVIFVDDVTWFCEDCEEEVVKTSSHDQSTLLPVGTRDSINLANDANHARIELTVHLKRVKENKQQQHNTTAKTKVLLSDSHGSSPHGRSQCSDNCEEENKFKKEFQPDTKDVAISSQGFVSVQNSQVATDDHLNFVELDDHVGGHPTTNPIWRGTLCLHNQSVCTATTTVNGLLAHLSSLACSKVLEETRLFPEVLCVDLIQRYEVWPNGFMNCAPTDENIALYFFPEDERVERDFDRLVDGIIEQDLAMRAMVENAELLVFHSTMLPLQHRRFQAKYYLWGVFRAKPTSPKTNGAVCGEDTGVNKPLTQHIPSNTLRNSGS